MSLGVAQSLGLYRIRLVPTDKHFKKRLDEGITAYVRVFVNEFFGAVNEKD